jgi:hypothetical protein
MPIAKEALKQLRNSPEELTKQALYLVNLLNDQAKALLRSDDW